jgi:hypothetical protein
MEALPYPTTRWTVLQKTAFLFFAVFFALIIIPNPFTLLPGDYWFKLIQWTGKYLLHIPYEITVLPNGSGDTTYNYVEVLLNLIITIITVGVWLLIDRRRASYQQLYYWSLVLVRYYLFFTMLQYGFFKVIQLQFPFPTQGELLQPLGDSSPMGLAWNFMGYSKAYNFFAGFLEILGGFLLCFRRTATLGALIVFGVMSNVVAMNFCFDIPVKIYSMQLLGMAVYIMWPDGKRLVDFLIRNRAVEPRLLNRVFAKKGFHIARIAVKSLLVAGLMIYIFTQAWGYQKTYGEYAPKPPLYGMYEVETFVHNGDTLPPLRSDTSRWHKMVISNKDRATVRMVSDSVRGFDFKVDPKLKTIRMSPKGDTLQKFRLTYLQPSKEQLIIKGRSKHDSLYIKFHSIDRNRYLLVSRGFHWINEFPLNR